MPPVQLAAALKSVPVFPQVLCASGAAGDAIARESPPGPAGAASPANLSANLEEASEGIEAPLAMRCRFKCRLPALATVALPKSAQRVNATKRYENRLARFIDRSLFLSESSVSGGA